MGASVPPPPCRVCHYTFSPVQPGCRPIGSLFLLPEASWVFVTVSVDCRISPLGFLLANYMLIY